MGEKMFKIDKKSEIPLYQQLAHSIKKAVDEQKLKENDKIPAENEFCKIYDLSRTTVRQALDILEKDGKEVMFLLLRYIKIVLVLVSFMMI